MFYTIYETTNNVNGKKYIGKHETPDPGDDYIGSGILLQKAIVKYGRENFSKKVLFVFDTRQEMNEKEIELVNIDIVASDEYYNIALGGQGGNIVLEEGHPKREETLEKIRKSQSEKSEFYREKAKVQHSKRQIGMYGKKQTDHQKARVSETMRGRVRSDEEKFRHNESLRATIDDPSYIHPNKGRAPSEEERKRISEGLKNLPKKTCPHCEKTMDPSNYGKYHGDKCKMRQ